MKNELREQYEFKEKAFLSAKHLENEYAEEVAALKNELKVRDASLASSDGELQKIISEKDAFIGQLKSSAAGNILSILTNWKNYK